MTELQIINIDGVECYREGWCGLFKIGNSGKGAWVC